MGIVPETRYVRGYSAQRYIVNAPSASDLGWKLWHEVRRPQGLRDVAAIVVLDLLCGNEDRHGDNWLFKDGRFIAIDTMRTRDRMSLRLALRPAFRSLLIDDQQYSFELMDIIDEWIIEAGHVLGRFNGIDEVEYDLAEWRQDLRSRVSS